MKIDIKNILIVVLLTISLYLVYQVMFNNSNNTLYKKELKELKDNNKILKEQRDSIAIRIKILESSLSDLNDKEIELKGKIDFLNKEIELSKNRANKSKAELSLLRSELAETKKKIDDFKRNPPNRTGNNLLNSLKNHMQ